VGLTAAALARRLCSGPVILGGLDFVFTDCAVHARATPGRRERLRRQTRLAGIINADVAFRRGVVPAAANNGARVRTDPVMMGYRDLFEREFAGDRRFRSIAGPGLPLGVKTLPVNEALALLVTRPAPCPGRAEWEEAGSRAAGETRRGVLAAFIRREQEALMELRDILTGTAPAAEARLEERLDNADYLWAHFPECAGAEGRRPPAGDISFLKRVRAEIDPFIGLWKQISAERR
jgi:hypothetical protein